MRSFVIAAVLGWAVGAGADEVRDPLRASARRAMSGDAAAIVALRAVGPAGLDALFELPVDDSARPGWQAAVDAVAKQKDAQASRLYWYTDFAQATAAAKAAGKPILSLRLLGNLDEEFSCANSRFFRTVLYANAEVSGYLRKHFVLHWKSVRPVPKVTIDFGDGRVLERTITGNSIHYVLDADGRPVDGLPGLYGPKAFLRGLDRAAQAVKNYHAQPESLRAYHIARLNAVVAEWSADLTRVGAIGVAQPARAKRPPTAAQAELTVAAKRAAEMPVVAALLPAATGRDTAVDDAMWTRIAALHAEDARLDEGSQVLMRAKNPTAFDAAPLTESKARVENPMLRLFRKFERSVAEDTVRNEYLLHRTIHEWFTRGAVGDDVEALNERVYAKLFLTPSSDPWLGLAPADVYTALPANKERP